ncbi:hypothetical protein [Lichenihabitans psoromatis]|uniref:hypothetical protein n=1 Tax=Lichenihabitans psoromatis TaxID=2528642 RepID=UPI0010364E96|nr:hypothetical protein [Lichenihabitans psoromatis]
MPTFENEAAAQGGCTGDGVVWADHRTGFYYPKFAPEHGVSPSGSFTCFKKANKADYWGFGTADSMESRRGRVFPIYPEPDCIWVVDKQGKGHCGAAGM